MNIMDLTQEEQQQWRDYVHALQEERKKIQVFQRELPLCLQLVNRAIESLKGHEKGDCTIDEAITVVDAADSPVLEEFIPLKSSSPSSTSSEDEKSSAAAMASSDRKTDWLKSAQLWNQNPNPTQKEEHSDLSIKPVVVGTGGAFQPFKRVKRQKHVVAAPLAPVTSSTTWEKGGCDADDKKENKEVQSHRLHRKSRRCWSPELHRQFLDTIQQLGGSHAATPKQIKELMKVDGLTNDEVKSHFQKYRLHNRRLTSAVHSGAGDLRTPHL